MVTAATQRIADPTTGTAGLLTQLLGQQGSTNQNSQALINQIVNGLQTGTQGTTSSNTTTSTAELGPLLQAFAQSSQGMDPAQLTALISSIFQEGAQKVPELTGAYANATGSRSTGNSGLQLALGDLNRQLSTAAVQQLLQYNQNAQRTAADAAAAIAGNTRQQTQTGQQQTGTTQQTSQNTNTAQQQQQQGTTKQGVNPNMAGLVGLGGTALNFLDKKGVFNDLFGRGGGATGTPGSISGGGRLVPTGGSTLANPLGSSATSGFASSAPAPSSGFLATPQSVAPGGGGFTMPGGVGGSAGFSPYTGNLGEFSSGLGGITGQGGFGSSGGMLGTAGDFGFGQLPSTFDAFGTAGTGSLGSNLNFGSNPFDYGGSAGGITGAVGGGGGVGEWLSSLGGGISGALGGASDWLGGIGDFVGGFFADGGVIANPGFGAAGPFGSMLLPARFGGSRFADGGMVANPRGGGAHFSMDPRFMPFGTTHLNLGHQSGPMPGSYPTPMLYADGGRVGYYGDGGSIPNPVPYSTVSPARFGGAGRFADGGQVSTGGGGPVRVRNQNFMGARPQREQSGAMNYEGYASPAVGASAPAGGSPSLAAALPATLSANMMSAAGTPGTTATPRQFSPAEIQAYFAEVAAQQAAQEALSRQGGGSGGVGEGGAPTTSATSGATTSGLGIGGQAANIGLGLAGAMGIPGLSTIASIVQALSNQIAAANQPINQATMDALIASLAGNAGGGSGVGVGMDAQGPSASNSNEGMGLEATVTALDAEGNAIGAPSTGSSGGTGGDSTGGGGGSGVGSGGSTGGSTSGEGGNAGGNYSDGGPVRGPGTGTSDSIKVRSREPGGADISYSDGEVVIPVDTVNHYGNQFFQHLIDMTHTPVNR